MDRRGFLARGAGLVGAAALGLPALVEPANAKAADLYVRSLLVHKADRRLFLCNAAGKVLKTYTVALGSQPVGHKRSEGDGRTPEGRYTLSRRIPNSAFYRSFAISYPNRTDMARATQRGVSPGGNICLHGTGLGLDQQARGDWTLGCIAVSDADMDDICRYVRAGMPIDIRA